MTFKSNNIREFTPLEKYIFEIRSPLLAEVVTELFRNRVGDSIHEIETRVSIDRVTDVLSKFKLTKDKHYIIKDHIFFNKIIGRSIALTGKGLAIIRYKMRNNIKFELNNKSS